MNDNDTSAPVETVWQGKFIKTMRKGRWEYVGRTRGMHAVVILAITDDDHVILVEQYRAPLGRPCVELPAGLVGDDDSKEGEQNIDAAIRELEEETGYRAEKMEEVGQFWSSPGMVSESFTLFRARNLVRVGPGGGVGSENITVHTIARTDMAETIAAWRQKGYAIDVKLMMLADLT